MCACVCACTPVCVRGDPREIKVDRHRLPLFLQTLLRSFFLLPSPFIVSSPFFPLTSFLLSLSSLTDVSHHCLFALFPTFFLSSHLPIIRRVCNPETTEPPCISHQSNTNRKRYQSLPPIPPQHGHKITSPDLKPLTFPFWPHILLSLQPGAY